MSDDIPEDVAFKAEAIPHMAIPWHNLPLSKLIHQNFYVIMSYAFSTPVLAKWVDRHFSGEWKYLNKSLFDMPMERPEADPRLGHWRRPPHAPISAIAAD